MKYLPKERSRSLINKTWSGNVFTPQKIKQKGIKKQYPARSEEQLQMIRDSLPKDGLIL